MFAMLRKSSRLGGVAGSVVKYVIRDYSLVELSLKLIGAITLLERIP
jgi:hypothetical protein